jgi:hypothetical protein
MSGFILDGQIQFDRGESIALHTPGGWLVRISTAWRQHVARHSIQLGFQEHYDAAADPRDWMLPGYDATPEDGWREPYVVMPAGLEPWVHMEERGVPLLADHVECFARVVAQFTGESARGYQVAEDVYYLPRIEQRKRAEFVKNVAAMLGRDDRVATIPPPPDGHFVAFVLDLGTYRTGHFVLDIADAETRTTARRGAADRSIARRKYAYRFHGRERCLRVQHHLASHFASGGLLVMLMSPP